jgi:hypothetical protein
MDSCPSSFIRVDTLTSEPEFGGVGVTQSVYESARDGCASGPARLNARLMRDCRVPRVMRSPSRPTNNGFRAGHWERPDATAMCFCLTVPGKRMARLRRYAVDDGEQFGLDGDAAVLAAFAFDMNDCGAVVGGADVTHIGLAQFLGP